MALLVAKPFFMGKTRKLIWLTEKKITFDVENQCTRQTCIFNDASMQNFHLGKTPSIRKRKCQCVTLYSMTNYLFTCSQHICNNQPTQLFDCFSWIWFNRDTCGPHQLVNLVLVFCALLKTQLGRGARTRNLA